MFAAGDRVPLEGRVLRVTGEVVALQLADGQAIQVAATHLVPAVETKALRTSERKVIHAEIGVPD
jgi:hypothetical protein